MLPSSENYFVNDLVLLVYTWELLLHASQHATASRSRIKTSGFNSKVWVVDVIVIAEEENVSK